MVNGTTKNGSSNGNGVHAEVAMVSEHDLGWDSLPPAATEKLAQPLDPGLVSQRKGRAGRSYDYLEGHAVIDQANRVFGYGGWGYELAGDVTLREIENVDAKTGEVKRARVYSAPVRVTVAGAPPRADIGFNAVAEDNADGHETAIKGAVTDGMKRALRSFGPQFGNALYGDGAADALAPALRKALVDLGASQGFEEQKVRDAVRSKTGKDLDELPASELTPMVEGAAAKLHQQAWAGAAKAEQAGEAREAVPQQTGDEEKRAAA